MSDTILNCFLIGVMFFALIFGIVTSIIDNEKEDLITCNCCQHECVEEQIKTTEIEIDGKFYELVPVIEKAGDE